MASWGVIGAVSDEVAPFVDRLEGAQRSRVGAADIYMGYLCGQPVTVARSGVGKVNAAAATSALLLLSKPSALVTLGSAGAIAERLEVGDVVVSSRVIQHDVGTYRSGEFRPSGIPTYDADGIAAPVDYLEGDTVLVREAIRVSLDLDLRSANGKKARVIAGTVATGDSVLASTEKQYWLRATFGAAVVDMESAAVAQVASAHGVPWVAVRAVSDAADDTLHEELIGFGDFTDGTRHMFGGEERGVAAVISEYHALLKVAAHNAAEIALALICGRLSSP